MQKRASRWCSSVSRGFIDNALVLAAVDAQLAGYEAWAGANLAPGRTYHVCFTAAGSQAHVPGRFGGFPVVGSGERPEEVEAADQAPALGLEILPSC